MAPAAPASSARATSRPRTSFSSASTSASTPFSASCAARPRGARSLTRSGRGSTLRPPLTSGRKKRPGWLTDERRQPTSFLFVAVRLEIELTSSRDDGTWTWRAAGARQPKGVLESDVLPAGSKVGDILRVEAEQNIDGINVTTVLPPKTK